MNSSAVRAAFAGISIFSILQAMPAVSIAGLIVNYSDGATSQAASAEFSFLTCNTLEIVLRELTPPAASPVSTLAGGSSVFTRIGFNLPSGQVTGGTVVIGPGGASAGFENVGTQLGEGDDVSSHWGFSEGTLPDALKSLSLVLNQESNTKTQEADALDLEMALAAFEALMLRETAANILSGNPDPQSERDAEELMKKAARLEAETALLATAQAEARARAQELLLQATETLIRATITPDLHFIGVLQPGQTAFLTIPPGNNLIGPGAFDGIQGGLLGDLGARSGQGVIGNSVVIILTLSDPFDLEMQNAFLSDVRRNSLAEYGNQAAFVSPAGTSAVPEPSTVTLLVAFGVTLLGTSSFRRLRRARPMRHWLQFTQ